MSEQLDTTALLAALQGQLKSAQPASGWTQPQAAPPTIVGLEVPIKVQTPVGEIRLGLQVQITQETATPDGIMGVLQSLQAQGFPLDIWQPKQSGGGWNSGNSGGGWNRGGGGYGGGGRRW